MADLIAALAATAGGVAVESDDDFANTVLLLHGDGTDGTQNNTFIDSSTNNFTITRNGNCSMGSYSPFSKPDGRWGNYFNGSTDLLTTPTGQTNLTLGTSDFTIEGFFYPTAQVQSNPSLFASSSDINLANTILVQFNSSTNEIVLFVNNVNLTASSTNNDIVLNTWNHIAVCRTGGDTYTFYINGTLVNNVATNSTSLTTNAWRIAYWTTGGNQYTGYINSFRIIKGTALYTGGSLTVPTSPLTAVTNTQLLTCQSNRFVDNSTNNYAITLSGTPKVTPFSPFPITTEYSPSVNGGSGYFDGSGDYLSLAGNSAFAIATSSTPFTIETWIYPTASGGIIFTDSYTGGGDTISIIFGLGQIGDSSGLTPYLGCFNGSAYSGDRSDVSLALNTWSHVACVFTGSAVAIYINGTSVATTGHPTGGKITSWPVTGDNGDSWYIGRRWDANTPTYVTGFLSSLRFVNGSAVYTSNFTPSTTPLTAITNTSLLLSATDAGIYDNTGFNVLESVGSSQVDTTTKRFGTGSLDFAANDGTAYLVAAPSENYNFGTGDFTIEFWVNPDTVNTSYGASSLGTLFDMDATAGTGTDWWVIHQSNTTLVFGSNSANVLASNGNLLTVSTWTHIALVRYGSTVTWYKDGSAWGSTTYSTTINPTNRKLYIAKQSGFSRYYKGYIDDLRISRVARYLTTFTPPTKAFPNIGS